MRWTEELREEFYVNCVIGEVKYAELPVVGRWHM
jgi:hypothetical protein